MQLILSTWFHLFCRPDSSVGIWGKSTESTGDPTRFDFVVDVPRISFREMLHGSIFIVFPYWNSCQKKNTMWSTWRIERNEIIPIPLAQDASCNSRLSLVSLLAKKCTGIHESQPHSIATRGHKKFYLHQTHRPSAKCFLAYQWNQNIICIPSINGWRSQRAKKGEDLSNWSGNDRMVDNPSFG